MANRSGGYPRSLHLEVPIQRLARLEWLVAPETRRRALAITTVMALLCGGLLAVVEFSGDSASTRSVLLNKSVGTVVVGQSPTDVFGMGAPPGVLHATSYDERLRLTAERESETGSWMLAAEPLGLTTEPPIIRFMVDGFLMEEVAGGPYRLLLSEQILEPVVGGTGRRPMIVTVTALWPDDFAGGPATIVLPRR